MESKTLRTIGASVVLAALLVAGIAQAGGGEQPAPAEIDTGKTTTTGAEATSATDAPEPFTYRVGVLSGVTTDNFWAFYGSEPSVWNSYVLGPTKSALFTTGASGAELMPELALSLGEPEQDDRGWFVTVELDPELSWSDGTPITSNDMVFTFETVRRLGLGGSWEEAFPEAVTAIEADGDHVIQIRFSDRPQLSVWPHGVGTAPVMAEHVWREVVDKDSAEDLYALPGDGDVSGGPLTITEVSDGLIVSVINDGYPSDVIPEIVEYHVYPDETAAVGGLLDGDIDYVLSPKGLASEQIERVAANSDVEVLTSPGNTIRYLGFNLEREPMSDQAFRTALALLLDREALAESIPHAAEPARSLVPGANTQWHDADSAAVNAAVHAGDPGDRLARAIEAMQSAGYTWETVPVIDENGDPVAGSGLARQGAAVAPLTILTPGDAYDPARPEYARAIADTLAILGFDVRPVETDFDTVVDLAFTPGDDGELHYDMYLLGWTLGNPVLPGYYEALFSEGGEMNNTGYASDEFGEAHASYVAAFTVEDARAALWDMERALTNDLPYLPLYNSAVVEAYRSDRVSLTAVPGLGGLQARLGGILDIEPVD